MLASGAMPALQPYESLPLPAMMPDDVGAVAVVIVRLQLTVDEVHELGDALVPVRAVGTGLLLRVRSSCQLAMPESITAMPMPGPCSRYLDDGGRRADRHRRPEVVLANRPVVVDPEDLGVPLQLSNHAVRELEHLAVDDVQPAVAADEPLELLRKLGARQQGHDDARPVATGCRSFAD